MIEKIQKRNGQMVAFDSVKILNAISRANMAVEDEVMEPADLSYLTQKVCSQLNPDEVVTVEHVQDVVEETLIRFDYAKTAKAYILYRAEHTKIRQTESDLMDIYSKLTYSSAMDEDIKRENANIDGDTAMGTMLKYGSEGAKYFVDNYVLPKDIAAAHINGDIHIHDKDFYMLTETCCQIDLIKLFKNGFSTGHGHLREPQSIISYAALACITIQANQNEMHGGQAIPAFDFYLAPYVRNSFIEEVKTLEDLYGQDFSHLYNKPIDDYQTQTLDGLSGDRRVIQHAINRTVSRVHQSMEAFIHNMNTIHSRGGNQVVFSSINYGTDTSAEGRLVIEELLKASY